MKYLIGVGGGGIIFEFTDTLAVSPQVASNNHYHYESKPYEYVCMYMPFFNDSIVLFSYN